MTINYNNNVNFGCVGLDADECNTIIKISGNDTNTTINSNNSNITNTTYTTTSPCHQTYDNTYGSYECGCHVGYKLLDDQQTAQVKSIGSKLLFKI